MKLRDLTEAEAVKQALATFDSLGGIAFRKRYGFGPSNRYYLSHAGRLYDAKAIAGVAYGYQHSKVGPLTNDQFDGGEAATNKVLRAMGFTVLDNQSKTVEDERAWRLAVWKDLTLRQDPAGLLSADAVRAVGAYGNFRGIWVDAKRTKGIHSAGVTVGLKHTGQHYADDLSDSGVLYHYPVTRRPGQDRAEVNATKVAADLGLPVFVIIEESELRSVRLAWVEGWEEESRLFLVRFGEDAPQRIIDRDRSDEKPFKLEGNRSRKRTGSVTVRPDQARFKLEVFQRYGPRCPLSRIAVPEMIEAAHLRGDADGGSSDARNGLPMNAALHRAFDADLFAINPETLAVEVLPLGPSLGDLGITHSKLDLPNLPHREALSWRYERWLRRTGR